MGEGSAGTVEAALARGADFPFPQARTEKL